MTNILHRGVSQGGSTLTQQLAKNLFLTQDRTLERKVQEVELALWLERKHSKDEILEMYLNRVYFGSGAYGVEAAAQRYFGKSAKNVTVAEAAMLAGLVKSPSRLAPNRNPEGAEAARADRARGDGGRQVHHRGAGAGLDRASLLQCEAGRRRHRQLCRRLDRRSARRPDRPDRPEHRGRHHDRSETAELAEAAIIDELAAKSVKFNVSQGALVAMTPDGAVRAMVGGRTMPRASTTAR